MPEFKHYTKSYLDYALREIEAMIYTVVGKLDIHAWCTHEPTPFAERQPGEERSFAVGDKWGDLFDCAWFHFTGVVPPQAAGQKVVLLLDHWSQVKQNERLSSLPSVGFACMIGPCV
jgi:alpha-mannosidase